METTLPTTQKNGQPLSTAMIDPFVDIFNSFFDTPFVVSFSVPKANVTEKETEIQIELAAPGLQKEDFSIEADGNLLTISAEKETDTSEGEKTKNHRREYNYSSFCRSFMLPESAQIDQTKAIYKDGILTVTVAKQNTPQKETKTISVE